MTIKAYSKESLIKTVSALSLAVTGKPYIHIISVKGNTRSVADTLYLGTLESDDKLAITLWRGYVDRALFRIAYHNVLTEQDYRPTDTQAALLFSYLMQLRFEICGIKRFSGSIVNIAAIYQQQALSVNNLEEKGLIFAIYALLPELLYYQNNNHDYIHYQSYYKKMHETLEDITQFAQIAAEYAVNFCTKISDTHYKTHEHDYLANSFHKEQDLTNIDTTLKNDKTDSDNNVTDNNISDMQEMNQESLSKADMFNCDETKDSDEILLENIRLIDEDSLQNGYIQSTYQIFTNKYDTIIEAEKLVKEQELENLHTELLKAKKNHQKVIHKLSRKLRSRLTSIQDDCYHYDLYCGTLDNQKIVKILTDPFDGRYFKDDIAVVADNTAVTLLIDNSGSMRGKPITMAALCADIIAETIERCGAKVEVLGFTTGAWRGGQSRKDYEKAGCPPMPGRLNDLNHIIYKDFDMPYKLATRSISVMLKESILKENIDGEALLWALNRLTKRPEKRRILTVISDGAPVDDSTSSANHGDYLESHLRKVIHYYENKTNIDIFALGIGHDVQSYYQKAVTVPNSEAVANALTEKFVRLF
jgi:cobaltochelatase CobT